MIRCGGRLVAGAVEDNGGSGTNGRHSFVIDVPEPGLGVLLASGVVSLAPALAAAPSLWRWARASPAFASTIVSSGIALFGVLGNLTYHQYNSLPASQRNLADWFERMKAFQYGPDAGFEFLPGRRISDGDTAVTA